jgi:hypothetical protein
MKRKFFSCAFYILSLAIISSEAEEGLISRSDNSESCSSDGVTDCNGSNRNQLDLETRLKDWFATLKDKTFNFGCKQEESGSSDEQVRGRLKVETY